MKLKPIKYIEKDEIDDKDVPIEHELNINGITSIVIDNEYIKIEKKKELIIIDRYIMFAPGWRDLITELTRRFEVEDLR